MHHWQGRPSLVFCSTRRGAQEAAVTLAETALKLGTQNPFIKSQEQYQRLQDAANLTNERQLQQCINCGVAFHNGGLPLSDRNLVEGLFLKGDLQVLCTTNTLAHGVNLPAHSVIIKSTQY
jgi:ATP-dependent DNA helicase HFM1/MER3